MRWLGIGSLVLISIFALLNLIGTVAYATGLVDETVDAQNLYSKYSLDHYQLDFFVDNSWDWLPWNWSDGIGKSVMYGLYAITNFIWTVSLYLSNATGYVIQEAYKLDFISDTADAIGKNIQTLAGITSSGFSSEGFYIGFLLLFVLIIGVYVAYVGLIKRESSKAIQAVINFVTVFLLSASFIAYAPSYITKINDFSSDISQSALSLGSKIVVPNAESAEKDSVDLIRDSLFSIQVQQPWLLLQYGNSNPEEIGTDRVEQLLSVSPDENNGENREKVVKTEIEDKKNTNLTLTKTMNRLGTVVFLFIFNLGISIFVFLLTGIMIFSQILFIIFAMFLPISFLLSMLPTYESMAKRALERLFNTIMMRAGITLVITTAFSISSMFYTISIGYPFFMVAFLQIVTFAGIYFKLGDLMGLFKLQSGDSQQVSRRIMRRPTQVARRGARQMERRLGRALTIGGIGAAVGSLKPKKPMNKSFVSASGNNDQSANTLKVENKGSQAGRKVGNVLELPNQMKNKAQLVKQQIKDTPTQAKYALYQGAAQAKENAQGFKQGIVQQKQDKQQAQQIKQEQHQQAIIQKQQALEKAKENRKPISAAVRPIRKNGISPTIKESTPPNDKTTDTRTKRSVYSAGKNEVKRPNYKKAEDLIQPIKNPIVKKNIPKNLSKQQLILKRKDGDKGESKVRRSSK